MKAVNRCTSNAAASSGGFGADGPAARPGR